ncbi:MAG: O-antigen ligase family protein [Chlorobi bacterium]|nr:O-antigen ligase family protein [Chlorobiota bacterium]
MIRFKDLNHYSFYLLGLIILALGISWSPFLISLSQAVLLTNWILEGNISKKINTLFRRKGALLFISIFVVHLIGVVYSQDISLAFKDIKIKLPLLIFPLVIATTKPVSFKQLKLILYFFLFSIFISSVLSVLTLLGYTSFEITNIRDISLFISHIRFSLLINIGIFSLVYLIYTEKESGILKIGNWFLVFWFVFFLFILQSYTGIIIFILTAVTVLIKASVLCKQKKYKTAGIIFSFLIPILFFLYLSFAFFKFYNIDKIEIAHLDKTTVNGNLYSHNTKSKLVENGHYIWIYVCNKELKNTWNKRSKINFAGKDRNGNPIKLTLIRYLTSKGLRKDAAGVMQLTETDIKNIENGIANYIFANKLGLYPRTYQIIWEFDRYLKGQNPSGHSVTQRIEYYKSAYHIFKNNILVGVGTGDLKMSYNDYYNKVHSRLTKKWRLRAHNQYFTFLVTFGLIGFVWIMYAFVYSIKKEEGFKNYFFFFFFFIAFLSMINEDTLETQIGATFFAYFYSLFLFGFKTKKQKNDIFE